MRKTIKEWFQGLSPEVAEKAINNTPAHLLRTTEPSLQGALRRSFVWEATNEGFKYWLGITLKIEQRSGLTTNY